MMSVVLSPETVTVWIDKGIPVRLVWRGVRYLVTDTPTPLRARFGHEGITHPLEPMIGWRFQGTNDDDESFVFDVHGSGRQEWRLVAVYR
ncbi:MAG: hypothetical protein ACOH1J_09505 [Microbacteriaceae bacterium]